MIQSAKLPDISGQVWGEESLSALIPTSCEMVTLFDIHSITMAKFSLPVQSLSNWV